ncbi:MAG: AAA family ATPase [Chloroflexi bacterium]|nr:AAA family ATPase [Chloroflexota bacterium]
MLTQRLQIQAIADRLAGLSVQANVRDFSFPWQVCWQAIETSEPGQEHDALYKAISGLPEQKMILETILATRPGYRPNIPSLADIATDLQPIEWVWEGWIPRGLITVLGAVQGAGKSFVAMDLAWRIIHDQGFPNGSPIPRPGANIIYVDAEMVPQILNERTQHYNLDQSKLFVMLPDPGEMIDLGLERYQDRLTEMTAVLNPELIIIDSLSSAHTGGQNNVEDIRSLMGYLIRLVSWAKCGLVLVHHIRKPLGGGPRMINFDPGMEDLSGSGYITQQSRVVLGLRVVQTGSEPDANGPRELKMLKTNLGPIQKSLGFTFAAMGAGGVKLKWDLNAPQPYREPTRLDECKTWLEDLLKTNPDGICPKDVIAAGKELDWSESMIFRARRDLRLNIQNTVGHRSPINRWIWSDKSGDEENQQEE